MISGTEILNLKQILAKNPKSQLFAYLADSLRQASLGTSDKLDEALTVANKGLAANPDSLQGRLARGRILLEKGDLHGAKIDFEAVAKRDQFCLSAQKLLIETSEKMGKPLKTELYAKILSALEPEAEVSQTQTQTQTQPAVKPPKQAEPELKPFEPELKPFVKPAKKESATESLSISNALDDILNEEDAETEILNLLSKAVDKIIEKYTLLPMPTPAPAPLSIAPNIDDIVGEQLASKVEDKDLPDLTGDIDSLLSNAVPIAKSSAPNIDDILGEQLASKIEDKDLPDLTGDIDSLLSNAVPIAESSAPNIDDIVGEQLASKIEDKDLPNLTDDIDSLLSNAVPIAESSVPNIDDIVSEQLAPKIEHLPDLTSDLDSLLSSAAPMPELEHNSLAAPNIDDIVGEQLASKIEDKDLPNLTSDIDSLLSSAAPMPGLEHNSLAAPSIDDIVGEQLASKIEDKDLPNLTSDIDSLLSNAAPSSDEPELIPYTPPANKAAPSIDDIVGEQLASKIEDKDLPDLTADMDSLLNHPTQTLAELYLDQGLPEKAVAVYKELLAQDPDNIDLKTKLTLAEVQTGI
jgi:tetratricopeptide (TPR) repeat protein